MCILYLILYYIIFFNIQYTLAILYSQRKSSGNWYAKDWWICDLLKSGAPKDQRRIRPGRYALSAKSGSLVMLQLFFSNLTFEILDCFVDIATIKFVQERNLTNFFPSQLLLSVAENVAIRTNLFCIVKKMSSDQFHATSGPCHPSVGSIARCVLQWPHFSQRLGPRSVGLGQISLMLNKKNIDRHRKKKKTSWKLIFFWNTPKLGWMSFMFTSLMVSVQPHTWCCDASSSLVFKKTLLCRRIPNEVFHCRSFSW